MRYAWTFFAFLASASIAAPLPRSTPESQGVDPAAVLAFVEHSDAEIDSLNSFIVVRHGRVVAEAWWGPYQANDVHQLYSLSKSFTSIAAGLTIEEGKLSLDDRVVDRLPDWSPEELSDHLSAIRVRDLLRMTTGHVGPELGKFRWDKDPTVEFFLSLEVALKPGTHFAYNTPATYTCAAIVEKATGEKLLDYLRPRLLEPMGIEDDWWVETAEGLTMGGSGFNLRTEAIAKFGLLLLHRGKWNGRQLVPAAWIDEATSRQTSTGSEPGSDWSQGYGYQFWQSTRGYRGDGAFGQFCLVLPEHDAVVAITSGTNDLQGVLRLVWDHLLPGMHDEPIADDATTRERLAKRAAALRLPTPEGEASSPLATEVAGTTFVLDDNALGLETVSLNGSTFTFTNAAGEQRLAVGHGEWVRNRVDSIEGLTLTGNQLVEPPSGTVAVAASGAWTADDTYLLRLCLYETPFTIDAELRFAGDEVTIDVRQNVGFHAELREPTRRGSLAVEVQKKD